MSRTPQFTLICILILIIAVFASPSLAKKGPPGGEEAGNNLSIPAIFVPDASGGPALRVPCGTYAVPGWDGALPSTVYDGYWLQKTTATWSADCATAVTASVLADWGDNLTTRPTVAAGKPVRVEVSLLDPAAVGMGGFMITNLTPELADRLATYGTRGVPEDAFTTGDSGAPLTRVFDTGATLTIELLDAASVRGQGPVDLAYTVIFDGPMTAEINSSGAVIYGYNWGSKGRKNTPAPGTYRITFRTVATTIIGITDTAGQNVPTWDATSTSVTVVLN